MPPWTILSILDWTTRYFQKNGMESARLDAELLLAHVLACDRMKLYLQFERVLTEGELASFKSLIQRRLQGEPIAYLTGTKEFWSMSFQVGPGVLVPRPESEVLVEAVVGARRAVPVRVLDIGTGSGILAIVLAKEFPQARIEAWDVSEEALTYARMNAEKHGVGGRIVFLKRDIKQMVGAAPCGRPSNGQTHGFAPTELQFDLIISNPPYIASAKINSLPKEISFYEPKQALDGGEDGLDFYRLLGQCGRNFLTPGGILAVEIGEDQGETVPKIFNEIGLKDVQVMKDYAGLNRVVMAKML